MHNSQKIIAVLLSVLIALLIITALTPIVSGQTNILSNSGFEGDLTGWSTVPGTATYSLDAATRHSGSSSVMGVETGSDNIGRLYRTYP